MQQQKVILIILDGWGIGDGSESDAIAQAHTPNIDKLKNNYPHSQLFTSGEHVGLPDGQMGNSEVGHLNIGSGRIVYQDLVRINKAIQEDSMKDNPQIKKAFSYLKDTKKKLHLIGLVSDGGVHSSVEHLYHLCDIANRENIENVVIHAITDGRDTDPKSGLQYIKNLEEKIANSSAQIGTLIGRYYAMDRDKRWDRIKKAYDLYSAQKGEATDDFTAAIQSSYQNNITDEFIEPLYNPNVNGKIEEGDLVICFNFRTDRLRELTTVFTQEDMPEEDMHTLPLEFYTMTNYDARFKNINVIYDKANLKNTIGEIISKAKLKQLRTAETEKYAHVTFFFSGGREEPFEGEDRILVHSPKVATYDLKPEMSAIAVKDKLIEAINTEKYDFIVVNFANGDMVGHTGVYPAIIKAIETIDDCIGALSETIIKKQYEAIIIADHGNSDFVKNTDGSPNTAHSLNPVPFILISDRYQKVKNGVLADVAPSILELMNIPKAKEMTGKSLLIRD